MAHSGRSTSWTDHLGAAVYYASASTGVQFSNKTLFAQHDFRFPIFVVTIQMLFTAAVTWHNTKRGLVKFEKDVAIKLLPICVVRMLNIVSGMVGTQQINIPMFVALRRFTMVFTISLEYILLRKIQPMQTVGAVVLMVGGALVAAATDLTFDLKGYCAIFANDVCTALYMVLVKRSPEAAGMSTQALMMYNSVMSIPMMLLLVTACGDLSGAMDFMQRDVSTWFLLTLFTSMSLGLVIDHSTFTSIKINGPLATSVTGSVKNILSSVVGAFAFGDFVYSTPNVAGLGVSMAGSVWYTMSSALRKHRETVRSPIPIGRAIKTEDPNGKYCWKGSVWYTMSSALRKHRETVRPPSPSYGISGEIGLKHGWRVEGSEGVRV